MKRDPRVPLADVARAGADIQRFTKGMERESFLQDGVTQAAVERKFEIIGEALNRLRQAHPELAARISDLRRIIGFRNVLAHGYDRAELERICTSERSVSTIRVRGYGDGEGKHGRILSVTQTEQSQTGTGHWSLVTAPTPPVSAFQGARPWC